MSRKVSSPKWVKDHTNAIESISKYVKQTLEDQKSKKMSSSDLFEEVRDEFGAKFLRNMMGMESKGKLNEERQSELFAVLQRQHLVTISNGVISLKLKVKLKPLAKWCIDHRGQVGRVADFTASTLKEESSQEMSRDDLFAEIRDEFGAKFLRKTMNIENKGKITKNHSDELFEALKRVKSVDIEEYSNSSGTAMIRLKSKEKTEKKVVKKQQPIKTVKREQPIKTVKRTLKGDDSDDMKIQEPPFKKQKLEKYVELFNRGDISQEKMVKGITKIFMKSKQKLEIHFHFELPEEQDEDVDMDSSDSDSSDLNI